LATIVTVDNLPVSFGVNHNHPSDHIGLYLQRLKIDKFDEIIEK
jgi:hypothetical protein